METYRDSRLAVVQTLVQVFRHRVPRSVYKHFALPHLLSGSVYFSPRLCLSWAASPRVPAAVMGQDDKYAISMRDFFKVWLISACESLGPMFLIIPFIGIWHISPSLTSLRLFNLFHSHNIWYLTHFSFTNLSKTPQLVPQPQQNIALPRNCKVYSSLLVLPPLWNSVLPWNSNVYYFYYPSSS